MPNITPPPYWDLSRITFNIHNTYIDRVYLMGAVYLNITFVCVNLHTYIYIYIRITNN